MKGRRVLAFDWHEWRRRLGYTQTQAAAALQVSESMYRNYEHGRGGDSAAPSVLLACYIRKYGVLFEQQVQPDDLKGRRRLNRRRRRSTAAPGARAAGATPRSAGSQG